MADEAKIAKKPILDWTPDHLKKWATEIGHSMSFVGKPVTLEKLASNDFSALLSGVMKDLKDESRKTIKDYVEGSNGDGALMLAFYNYEDDNSYRLCDLTLQVYKLEPVIQNNQ